VNIVAIISREWSKDIILNLIEDKKNKIQISLILTTLKAVKKPKNVEVIYLEDSKYIDKYYKKIKLHKPTFIITYGWSEYISKELRDISPCLILHPSPLPFYRGGSPIQNQIINNEIKSAVSIILAEDKIDTGDILYQNEIEFTGYLDEILERIIQEGIKGTKKIISDYKINKLVYKSQNNSKSTTFKRINKNELEISPDDFKNKDAKYFYNLVRGFQEPYPKIYIKCKDNSILYLEKVGFSKT
tara:strand:+ start:1491 stop:2222 length:732 start_codon:yes stop_codon:yes gene_type:complete